MPLVTYKDLCIDAVHPHVVAEVWAPLLGLEPTLFHDDGDAKLAGPEPGHTIWLNGVPEARSVKQRVHLDLRHRLDAFADRTPVPRDDVLPWTTFVDDEVGEFCVFDTAEPPPRRLKAIEVDATDHRAIAGWWQQVWGGSLDESADDYTSVDAVPGAPFDGFDFAGVPEPKTVKNRIHWDVTLEPGVSVDDLVAAGARVLRRPDDEVRWTVMADPEGNEFCVFEAAT